MGKIISDVLTGDFESYDEDLKKWDHDHVLYLTEDECKVVVKNYDKVMKLLKKETITEIKRNKTLLKNAPDPKDYIKKCMDTFWIPVIHLTVLSHRWYIGIFSEAKLVGTGKYVFTVVMVNVDPFKAEKYELNADTINEPVRYKGGDWSKYE